MENPIKIKRALISVSDKTQIVELARFLHSLDIELLSTGGTANLLHQHNIPVLKVEELTGFPEMMEGRVKTLHPILHGGILARADVDDDVLVEHQIPKIDLVIVNLYPFEKEQTIENIDIGGPTLLRAAAKNFQRVTVVIEVTDYPMLMSELKNNHGATLLSTRFSLAKKVFAHTARYDGIIANYLTVEDMNGEKNKFPDVYTVQYVKKQDLRYGENPHQNAAWYEEVVAERELINTSQQVQGKPLSYNNLVDADTAFQCVNQFQGENACVIVKHANPCGVAIASLQEQAYLKSYLADATSAFGGVIAFNTPLQANTVRKILDQQFVEVIIAPSIAQDALALLQAKPQIRVLSIPNHTAQKCEYEFKRIQQGMLIQEQDHLTFSPSQLDIVPSKRSPTPEEAADLIFAWKVCKFVKSNAIVYAKNTQTIGIGAGQMSRVFSSKIAGMKAQEANLDLQHSVMASDAFFPFRDAIDEASKLGITAIIQPGGSIRDKEIIQAADEANIAMVFTHIRHFRH